MFKLLESVLKAPDRFLTWGALLLIRFYQKTISPDHSALGKTDQLRGCKFYPSCSNYAVEVLKTQGFILGLPKIFWRLLRCHPWSHGGVDKP